MKKITIKYSDEYINELVESEIRRRRILAVLTVLDFICKICIGMCVVFILGSTGTCENNAMGTLEYILWAIGSLVGGAVSVYAHAFLKYKIIEIKRRRVY